VITRRRLGSAVLASGIALVLALGGFEAWLFATFHTLNPFEPPPLIRTWGGEYRRAGTVTLAAVESTSSQFAPEILEPTLGKMPLQIPSEPHTAGTLVTTMRLWLHVGPDAYVEYHRAGGP
jgi:hypothetical protein